jgi:hypothetical protein
LGDLKDRAGRLHVRRKPFVEEYYAGYDIHLGRAISMSHELKADGL